MYPKLHLHIYPGTFSDLPLPDLTFTDILFYHFISDDLINSWMINAKYNNLDRDKCRFNIESVI